MSTGTGVHLCGPLVARIDGRTVELPGRQGRLVFTYLMLRRPRTVRREELIEPLWPRDAPASADATLISVLSRLRRALVPASSKDAGSCRWPSPAGST